MAKAPTASPGNPNPVQQDPGQGGAPEGTEDQPLTEMEQLRQVVAGLAAQVDEQADRIASLEAAAAGNPRVAAQVGPPPKSVEQAQREANEAGRAVLSVDGWVAPQTSLRKAPRAG